MVSLYEILDEMTISSTVFGRLIMTQFMAAMLQKKLSFKASIAWIVGQPFLGSGKSREQWSGTGGGGGASLEDVKKWSEKYTCIWDGADQRANQRNNWTAVTLTGIGTGAKQPDKNQFISCWNAERNPELNCASTRQVV